MDDYTTDELREALRPVASLIGKSEKALGKLAPGTWQHAMLRENLGALRLAAALMSGEAREAAGDERRDALRAFASMIRRTEDALGRFPPGTPQHTLQRNRLGALRVGEALVSAERGRGGDPDPRE